jgi:citrate synthase
MASASDEKKVAEGLEGVVVTATVLSDVDGDAGRLVIAGHDVEQLGASGRFEDAASALWSAASIAVPERTALSAELGAMRVRAFELLPRVRGALDAEDGMDALRGAVAQVVGDVDERLATAAVAVFAAAWWRIRNRTAPLAPDAAASHAADYLRMATGVSPSAAEAHAMGAYLSAVSDHGMNASTFAARVVASTGSDLVSSVVAAIGALKGPLHGGAPGPVLDMLDAIGAPDRADAWVEAELGSGRRIMGMGHRVYRVRDPRAAVLESAVLALRAGGKNTPRLELARAVEAVATGMLAKKYPARSLQANVEFYTAVLLDALGLDRRQFTPTFAVGRVAGWCAHVAEQRARGRLIRPQSVYVGRVPTLEQQHR